MIKMKRTLRLVLVLTSAILLTVIAAVAASADSENILFPVWGKDSEQSYEIKGEIGLGENTVTVDDGCWKLEAENAGYYGYVYSNPDSESLMDVAQLKNGKAEIIYTENMFGFGFDWVENGENAYLVFYLENPGTYYIRFSSTNSIYGDKEAVPSTDDISFVCFGELESLEISKDPLLIETDICLWWREEESKPCYFGEDVETYLTFTSGRYKIDLLGYMDKWESGKRVFTYDLGNGPELSKELTLTCVTDTLETVSFPEGFNPAVKYSYKAADSEYPNSHTQSDCAFPEWVELKFNDGSSVKAFTNEEAYVSGDKFAYFEDNEHHEHWVLLQYLRNEDGSIYFTVKVDGVVFGESKVKAEYNVISAYMNHLSGCMFFLKRFAGDMIFSPAAAISSLSNNLREEFREFSAYLKEANIF